MGMLTDRIRGISVVVEDRMLAIDEEMGKGDRVEKSDLFGDGVCSGNQRIACSVEREWEVHPGVATLESKVAGDKGQEDKWQWKSEMGNS